MNDALLLEKAVLGGILANNEDSATILSAVNPEDFTIEAHRKLINTLTELAAEGQPLGPHSAAMRLNAKGQLDVVSLSGLVELRELWAPSLNAERYVRDLQLLTSRRKLVLAGHRLIQRAEDETESPAAIVERAQAELSAVASDSTPSRSQTTSELIARAGGINEFLKAKPGLATPFRGLNAITGGLEPGSVTILAARPSIGKTALALQMARHAATKGAVVFSTLEMSSEPLVRRAIASKARVSYQQLRLAQLTPEQRLRVSRATAELSALPIYFEGTTGQTVLGLRAELRRLAAKQSLALVVVDYLQLMHAPSGKRENRTVEVGEISRGLKLAAIEFNVPFLVLSQLTRNSAREARQPVMSDLRDSGSIEQDGDIVMFIHRDEAAVDRSGADLIVAKQRNGPLATIRLHFHGEQGLFVEPMMDDETEVA